MITWKDWEKLYKSILKNFNSVLNSANKTAVFDLVEKLNKLIFTYHNNCERSGDQEKGANYYQEQLLVINDIITATQSLIKIPFTFNSAILKEINNIQLNSSKRKINLQKSIEFLEAMGWFTYLESAFFKKNLRQNENFSHLLEDSDLLMESDVARNVLLTNFVKEDKFIQDLLWDYCLNKSKNETKAIAVLNWLHELGVDFNQCNQSGNSTIVSAIKAKRVETLKFLIAKGADVTVLGEISPVEPLLTLLRKSEEETEEHLQIIKLLVNAGLSLIDNGEKLLREVVPRGRKKTTTLLLELGAKSYSEIGEDAIRSNNIQLIDLLITQYNITLPSNIPYTSFLSLEMFQFCFNKKMSLEHYDLWCENVLKTPQALKNLFEQGSKIINELSFSVWCNPDLKTKSGYPAHYAALKATKESIAILINAGIDISIKDGEGRTPLHYAAASGNTATTKMLILAGADMNAIDDEGMTPLHWAVFVNVGRSSIDKVQCVEILLYAGAKPDLLDKKRRTPLDCLDNTLYATRHKQALIAAFEIPPGTNQFKKAMHSLFALTANKIWHSPILCTKNLHYRKNQKLPQDIIDKLEEFPDSMLTPKASTSIKQDTVPGTTDDVFPEGKEGQEDLSHQNSF